MRPVSSSPLPEPSPDCEPQSSPVMQLIALPACVIVVAIVLLAAISGMASQSAPVIGGTAAALAVSVSGIAWTVLSKHKTPRESLAVLTAVGLSGALQCGLQPAEAGYIVIYVALIGLGMDLPPRYALRAAAVILAAANAAFLLAGYVQPGSLVADNVGAAFFLTVGLYIQATRAAQLRARSDQARAERLLAELQASQAARAEAAALTERTRLAREIHDILAHSLSGLVLALDAAELIGRRDSADPDRDAAGTVTEILGQVHRAQRIARDGLGDTRRAISALRGDELPGPALLDRLVRETSGATGIQAGLTVTGEPRPLAPEVGLALYRTAQEALINTAKYAGRGGQARVGLSYEPDGVELAVEDTRAPDAPPPAPGLTFGGYGLTGMRERAELLGGSLTAGPAGAGFGVRLWLPDHKSPVLPAQRAAEAR